MSRATDRDLFETLRSERRWAIAEKAAMWIVGAAVAVFSIALISAAVVVTMDVWGIPDRGVIDGGDL
jgi:hypothetical protein